MTELLTFAIGAALGAMLYAAGRALLSRLRRQERVIEEPNSHYTSKSIRDREIEASWKRIALERVHEINRDEVRRLIAKAERYGVDALGPHERTFLDHLAKLFGTRDDGPGHPPLEGAATQV
ncbi:MAG: hypothetical protein L0271_16085 [Gemmatimonadetes bacterium]|nr:hypothetical protein [Gemmatimonadota bacterium]